MHSLPVEQAQAWCSWAKVDVCRGRLLAQAMEAALQSRSVDDDTLARTLQPSRAEGDGDRGAACFCGENVICRGYEGWHSWAGCSVCWMVSHLTPTASFDSGSCATIIRGRVTRRRAQQEPRDEPLACCLAHMHARLLDAWRVGVLMSGLTSMRPTTTPRSTRALGRLWC